MRIVLPGSRRTCGLTLFEVLLALGVFGVAALALVKTIQLMGELTLESRTLRQVELGLESVIDEYGKVPGLAEINEEIKADSKGVAYRVIIRPVEGLRNKDGRELQGFFSIRAIATWKNAGRPMQMEAETVRFVNAFVPTQ